MFFQATQAQLDTSAKTLRTIPIILLEKSLISQTFVDMIHAEILAPTHKKN